MAHETKHRTKGSAYGCTAIREELQRDRDTWKARAERWQREAWRLAPNEDGEGGETWRDWGTDVDMQRKDAEARAEELERALRQVHSVSEIHRQLQERGISDCYVCAALSKQEPAQEKHCKDCGERLFFGSDGYKTGTCGECAWRWATGQPKVEQAQQSRSVQRRVAIQQGKPMPTFKGDSLEPEGDSQ